jgi:hypothetical protein
MAAFGQDLIRSVAGQIAKGKLDSAFNLNGYEVVLGLATLGCRYSVSGLGWTTSPNNFIPYIGE